MATVSGSLEVRRVEGGAVVENGRRVYSVPFGVELMHRQAGRPSLTVTGIAAEGDGFALFAVAPRPGIRSTRMVQASSVIANYSVASHEKAPKPAAPGTIEARLAALEAEVADLRAQLGA